MTVITSPIQAENLTEEVNQIENIQENTIKIGDTTYNTLQEAVNSAEVSTINVVGEFSLNSDIVIAENKDIVIDGGKFIMSDAETFLVSGRLTLNNVEITAETNAGKAPITLNKEYARFESNNMILTNLGGNGLGYQGSKHAIQIDKNRDGAGSPDSVEIILNDSLIKMDGIGARGISFAGKSEGTKIKLNNSKILNGTDSMNEWKGSQSRGISLQDTKGVDVDIKDSELSGWQYVIYSIGTKNDYLTENNLVVKVDNSILCGWTGFYIRNSASVLNIINNSHILGINGTFNADKKSSFATIVIEGGDVNQQWDPVTNNSIRIEDSTIEAVTQTEETPAELLIRIENSNNGKLEILGDSKLISNVQYSYWPYALYNKKMEDKAEAFITQKVEVEPTVQINNGFVAFATDSSQKEYYIGLELESNQRMGTVSVADEFKNKLIETDGEVEIIASAKSGYKFVGWYDTNNTLVSTDAVTSVRNLDYKKLIAKFDSDGTSIPSEPNISGGTDTGDKVKVEEVKTDKEVVSTLGKENVLNSVVLKEDIDKVVNYTVNVGRKHANETVYVVQINPTTQKMELVTVSIADKKGQVEFSTQSNEVLTLTKQLPSGFIGTADTQSETYYINEEHQFQKGWLELEDGWYFFDYESAVQRTNRWICDDIHWYFMADNGVMKENSWIWRDDNSAYYVNDLGVMEVGPKYIDGWYIDDMGIWNKN